jgi:hypothetical protein
MPAHVTGHDSSPVHTLAFSVMSVHAAVGGLFPPIGCWNGSIDIGG